MFVLIQKQFSFSTIFLLLTITFIFSIRRIIPLFTLFLNLDLLLFLVIFVNSIIVLVT